VSDRYKALTVALDRDTRDDDAQALIAAIRQLRGVVDVQPVEATADDWLARQRVRHEIADDFHALWRKIIGGPP
jgi:hypothetical protein